MTERTHRIEDGRIDTVAVHAGAPRPRIHGAVVPPIFQSTVFETPDEVASYDDIVYPRLNNLPNHQALGKKIAALEAAEAGLVFGSGMAAISTALLAVVGKGGHLLAQEQLYGGTRTFVEMLDRWGVEYDFIDADDPRSWDAKLRPNTRAIYVESIANPLVEIADHRAVVDFAKARRLVSMIDNTFATPVNFRPLKLGYDLALHSCTKYMNGHSDIVAGAVAGSSRAVREILLLLNHLGGSLDPHACFLLDRGLKTLPLRVRRQNENALALARHLSAHPAIAAVHYPGLESHPRHDRARELFSGFGGMLACELAGGEEAAEQFVRRLEMITYGPSLGGVETLVTRPAVTSHAGLAPAEREALGITGGLLRVSVGIEAIEDILADFGFSRFGEKNQS